MARTDGASVPPDAALLQELAEVMERHDACLAPGADDTIAIMRAGRAVAQDRFGHTGAHVADNLRAAAERVIREQTTTQAPPGAKADWPDLDCPLTPERIMALGEQAGITPLWAVDELHLLKFGRLVAVAAADAGFQAGATALELSPESYVRQKADAWSAIADLLMHLQLPQWISDTGLPEVEKATNAICALHRRVAHGLDAPGWHDATPQQLHDRIEGIWRYGLPPGPRARVHGDFWLEVDAWIARSEAEGYDWRDELEVARSAYAHPGPANLPPRDVDPINLRGTGAESPRGVLTPGVQIERVPFLVERATAAGEVIGWRLTLWNMTLLADKDGWPGFRLVPRFDPASGARVDYLPLAVVVPPRDAT